MSELGGSLSAPDWYPAWRHDAIHKLMAKQDELERAYGLWRWPRYDYDVNAGTLVFSNELGAKITANIQVVGTTGKSDWLWSWANDHWPKSVTDSLLRVREFGVENDIEELTTEYLDDGDLNVLGWAMTAVAARILDSRGAYRTTPDPGAVFFVIGDITGAN